MKLQRALVSIELAAVGCGAAHADEVGCVSTVFKWLGPKDRICIGSYRDPKVDGVVCHVSRAVTGGVKGAVRLAEDTSEFDLDRPDHAVEPAGPGFART